MESPIIIIINNLFNNIIDNYAIMDKFLNWFGSRVSESSAAASI